MKKESIDKATQAVLIALDTVEMDTLDKFELMKILYTFLKNYDVNRKVLSEYTAQRRYENVQTISNDETYTNRHK